MRVDWGRIQRERDDAYRLATQAHRPRTYRDCLAETADTYAISGRHEDTAHIHAAVGHLLEVAPVGMAFADEAQGLAWMRALEALCDLGRSYPDPELPTLLPIPPQDET
jgi:hypothetical protein